MRQRRPATLAAWPWQAVGTALRYEGYEVHEAGTGRDALTVADDPPRAPGRVLAIADYDESVVHPPVFVHVTPNDAAELLAELLGEDYGAVVSPGAGDAAAVVNVEPIDETRRGVVIYRVIQASRTVAERHPDASMFLVTEEGSRWRLPPPAI